MAPHKAPPHIDPAALIAAIINVRAALIQGTLKENMATCAGMTVDQQTKKFIDDSCVLLAVQLNAKKTRYEARPSDENFGPYNHIANLIASGIQTGGLSADAFGVRDLAQFKKTFLLTIDDHERRRIDAGVRLSRRGMRLKHGISTATKT